VVVDVIYYVCLCVFGGFFFLQETTKNTKGLGPQREE